MNKTILQEVATAYCDSNDQPDPKMKRNLHFRASQGCSPEMAEAIMEEVCPEYNLFKARFLGLLPSDCTVTLAREGSVCIYVRKGETKIPTRSKLKADEYNVLSEDTFGKDHYAAANNSDKSDYGGYKGELRIWWD